jgi:hypothetical protein
MAVFHGYFDDSNKSDDPRANCVAFAGFIAPADSWKTFEPTWKSVLDRFEISHFHMADLKPCTGPFADKEKWKDTARSMDLLSALVGVIKDSNLQAFSACLWLSDFQQFAIDKQTNLDPEALVIYAAFIEVLRAYARSEPIEVTIDRMAKPNRTLGRAKDYALTDSWYPGIFDNRLLLPLPKEGKLSSVNVLPLQAADFLAWETTKAHENKIDWHRKVKYGTDAEKLGSSLFKWSLEKQMELMVRNNEKGPNPIWPVLQRRSLLALSDAVRIEASTWNYQTLCKAHEIRGGVWTPPS